MNMWHVCQHASMQEFCFWERFLLKTKLYRLLLDSFSTLHSSPITRFHFLSISLLNQALLSFWVWKWSGIPELYRSIEKKSYLNLALLRNTPSPCCPFPHTRLCVNSHCTWSGPRCICAGLFCTGLVGIIILGQAQRVSLCKIRNRGVSVLVIHLMKMSMVRLETPLGFTCLLFLSLLWHWWLRAVEEGMIDLCLAFVCPII